jgi:hypothetical protein
MQIIDDEGNLFGLVNVIDALVVLLVLGVVVAGAALIFGGNDQPEPEPTLATTNVTLDLGAQPAYIVDQLNEGDSYSPTANTQLTITDLQFTPRESETQVLVRAQLRGIETGESIGYDGAPPRLGRNVGIATDSYVVNGTIRDVGGSAGFATDQTTVQLRTSLSSSDARSLDSGDSVSVAGRPLATIDDVTVYDGGDRQIAYVTATLQTITGGDRPQFGATALREGVSITLPTDDVVVDGQIQGVGSGVERDTTQVLVRDTVSSETAVAIDEGDAYRVAGRDIATVESVAAYGTNNPNQMRVYVGLDLTTIRHGDRPAFGATTVREGVTIPFQTPEYALGGTVERVGAIEQRGAATHRTVTLQMRNVAPDLARTIDAGVSESTGETTVARIEHVDRTNSTVILTSDDGNIYQREHPVNQDLTIEANLSVRETTTGTTFKGEPLQRGSQIVLDLGDQTIRATVVSL